MMRRTKLFASNFFCVNSPDLYVAHGGVTVAKLLVHILLHDDLQCLALAIVVFLIDYFAPGNHALCLHAVAASHFGMLVHQRVVYTDRDANLRVATEDGNASPLLGGVQVEGALSIAEVHWNHIGGSVGVGQAYEADLRLAKHLFDKRFVLMYDCLHKECIKLFVAKVAFLDKGCNLSRFSFV